ncbi:MAG: hypoxanthine-guanine phosphoribosyltransferase [Nitrosomonas sp.]|nr:hypoxanthine-guanine phosphoribosyltransferase [Nitrosomonas sp.]
MKESLENVQQILKHAELIYTPQSLNLAIERLAKEISAVLSEQFPLVLSVMGGAIVFTGQLLPLLNFPLDFDYVHASRYNHAFQGSTLHWKIAPPAHVSGRVILVLDDVLDEGHTMAAVRQRVLAMGATQFYCAVLADKTIGKEKPIRADFVGITLPNRLVFGFGIDIKGMWRNLPAIYAVKE